MHQLRVTKWSGSARISGTLEQDHRQATGKERPGKSQQGYLQQWNGFMHRLQTRKGKAKPGSTKISGAMEQVHRQATGEKRSGQGWQGYLEQCNKFTHILQAGKEQDRVRKNICSNATASHTSCRQEGQARISKDIYSNGTGLHTRCR
jgi:hypothetical protein